MNKAQSARIATESGKFKGFEPYKPYPCAMLFRSIYRAGVSTAQQHHRDRLLGCQELALSKRHIDVTSPVYDRLVITTNCNREPFWRPIWTKGINMKHIGKMLDPGK